MMAVLRELYPLTPLCELKLISSTQQQQMDETKRALPSATMKYHQPVSLGTLLGMCLKAVFLGKFLFDQFKLCILVNATKIYT